MSMSIRNQKQFNEVTRRVWGQLFGIMMRKARQSTARILRRMGTSRGDRGGGFT